MQRLYILRNDDIFPMVLTLPATSLRAFEDYRIAVGLKMKKMYGILTRVGLKEAKNAGGTNYSIATFEAMGLLSVTDAEKMRAYSESIGLSALRAGITSDDYAADARETFHQVNDAHLPEDWKQKPDTPKAQQTNTFMPADDDELPTL